MGKRLETVLIGQGPAWYVFVLSLRCVLFGMVDR